ncbi:MAG TPA: methionyl-tRNA formyltransferase, partial [Candidatus Melainabacteria bacterium]|nr:methionyl-tRNA formyltransferase [Candidatus Melainabacteria bacterium]
ARKINNRVRGLQPWPGTSASFKNSQLKIWRTKAQTGEFAETQPGTLLLDASHVYVSCGPKGTERLELIEVQPSSKNRMPAQSWANGIHLKSGEERFD